MTRRTFHCTALGASATFLTRGLAAQDASRTPAKYEADWNSLSKHQVPDWYRNAKLGIFIHWGLYSVPAWAPTTGELGKVDPNKWFAENPYAEWYLNSLRIKDSPTYRHHLATYGANFDYYDFAPIFNKDTAQWNPNAWAELFKKTSARYVVLTTKHHDGFTLWPSQVANPKTPGRRLAAQRDLVGDLTRSVRKAGMQMGLYYSGGLDWTFEKRPITNRADLHNTVPQSEEYAHYADAHWRELTHRYQPAVMWNDISYPKAGQIASLFAEYYNTVPNGVINNRFGVEFSDFTTPEYAKYDKITEKKWEACRGLGFSFGYNQVEGPEQVIAPDKLIALFVDIVSKNGNLLLNVGPKANGEISDIQIDRLHKLGDWLAVNSDGIFDSRPWIRASGPAGGPDVRFTKKGDAVYAYLLDRPKENTFTIPSVMAGEGTTVQILGQKRPARWTQRANDLLITSSEPVPGAYAVGARITPAPRS